MSVSLATVASEADPAPVPAALAILVLALLLSLQPVTTDLYLPALPALTRSLGAPVAAGQMTLSALLLAFGCSQMVWGPLSDRFGRRPVLLTGLSLYTLASLGSALASSMTLLIVWRAAQGMALGAVVMCARAIVRDLYSPVAGARAMSKALTGLGIMACLCVPLGGLLTEWLGWRAALLALTAYALVTLCVVALRLPETLALRNPKALQPATMVRTWKQVLSHPTFWAFSLQTTFTYCGLISFLAASPFVFIEVLGCSRAEYGLLMSTTGVAYFLGTFLCRFALGRIGLRRTAALGGALSLAGGMGLLSVALAGWTHPWALLLPFYLYMLGHGIHQSCGQSGAVGPFPRAAGVASALNGVMMMLMAFAIGGWLGRSLNGTIWPLIYSVTLWSVVLAAVSWTLVQKFGEPHEQ
jgi:DHA1 family bicyclomycin/chloramphenicol resistance-like MFS transporter